MSDKQYFISQLFIDIQLKQGKGKRIDPCAKLFQFGWGRVVSCGTNHEMRMGRWAILIVHSARKLSIREMDESPQYLLKTSNVTIMKNVHSV